MATTRKRPTRAPHDPIWMYQLRITLLDVQPSVWRTVLVPETITLPRLHAAIQATMGWTNSHLHEFVIGGRRYTDYLEDEWGSDQPLDERRVKLEAALGRAARTFDYVYDFGDDWHHAIVLEQRHPLPPESTASVTCLAGECACPPEDVGGAWGYADFLEAIADPSHPEHEQMLTWCGGEFDPQRFDIERVNEILHSIKA
jgi:hypothetical protein